MYGVLVGSLDWAVKISELVRMQDICQESRVCKGPESHDAGSPPTVLGLAFIGVGA